MVHWIYILATSCVLFIFLVQLSCAFIVYCGINSRVEIHVIQDSSYGNSAVTKNDTLCK